MGRKAMLAIFVGAAFAAAVAFVPAHAQSPSYPPIILDPDICLGLFGDVRIGPNGVEVLFEGHFGEEGGQGCAQSGEHTVGTVNSTPVLVGDTLASEDGSYRFETVLPSSVQPGPHIAAVDFGDGRAKVERPIIVVRSFVSGAGGSANDTTSSTGTLPKTGRDIALLVLFGLVLVAIGAVAVTFARKLLKSRPQRGGFLGGKQQLLLPAPTVPMIDTSGFTDRRYVRRDGPDEMYNSEADLLRVAASDATTTPG